MLKLSKFPPPYGEGLAFYYTSHVTNRYIPHVHRVWPLNGRKRSEFGLFLRKFYSINPFNGNFCEPGRARFAEKR